MFDFNNDGKTTPDEDFIAYNIYSKTSCGTNYSKSYRSSGKIILGIIIALLVFYIIGRIGNSSSGNSTSYKGSTSRSSYSSITSSRSTNSSKTESKHKENSISGYSDRSRSEASGHDGFNARDYYDAEDFYEDNYDDFFDYENAEDYYYEHYDD